MNKETMAGYPAPSLRPLPDVQLDAVNPKDALFCFVEKLKSWLVGFQVKDEPEQCLELSKNLFTYFD